LALAEDNAGNNIAARIAITAITTSNSTKVNALLRAICDLIEWTVQTLLNGRHPLPKGQSSQKQTKPTPSAANTPAPRVIGSEAFTAMAEPTN
jgi:hypothetical protein